MASGTSQLGSEALPQNCQTVAPHHNPYQYTKIPGLRLFSSKPAKYRSEPLVNGKSPRIPEEGQKSLSSYIFGRRSQNGHFSPSHDKYSFHRIFV
jgi:hypothetical protein